jgi:hypothetical protein
MKTINKQTENMGGVLRLWAIPVADLSVAGPTVTINSDANMVSIYVREDSAAFIEEQSNSFAGSIYKVEITAIVPCDTSDTLKLIEEMERRRKYLVIYLDGNGNYKLAGNVKVPLRFSAKGNSANSASGLNHYAITFAGNQLKRAIFISDPFS